MAARTPEEELPEQFRIAVESVRESTTRPEVVLAEAPAPLRLAPYALAMTGEVVDAEDVELASGRLVVLHDPEGHDTWQGAFRLVTFVRAALEPEIAMDPFLPGVGWQWLLESLERSDAAHVAASGTVTRVVSESFGTMDEEGGSSGVEIRASWTPLDAELGRHVTAWCELLCAAAGLPPRSFSADGSPA